MILPIKVMLVDDEMPVRDAYGRWLENDGRAIVVGEAFSRGADGYIWKNETGDAIATAIQRVHEGKLVATISVAEKMLGKIRDLGGRDYIVLPRKKRHKALSEILYRTMKLYCYDGLSAKEIANREHVSLDGINSRIKKAKEILGVSGRREAFRLMSELSEDTT